jgi:hypothetical protein
VGAHSGRRGGVRRLAVLGALALTAAAAPAARAAVPPPTPVGDDVGFVQFGAVAERVAQAYYSRALATPGLFDRRERRQLVVAHRATRQHIVRLNAVLGADAVGHDDFAVVFPKHAFDDRTRVLRLGERVEGLLLGVYLNGVGYGQDAATRLLLGRLLGSATKQRSELRAMRGVPPIGGLAAPLDLDAAGAQLDALLTVPGAPA